MAVEPLKKDTYEVERFSALTARFIQEKFLEYFNDIYINWKDGTLKNEAFYENSAKFSVDMRDKLRELKEIDSVEKLKEVFHFGWCITK